MPWEGDRQGREASARPPPWSKESRCQGRGWGAPSRPSTAVWTSATQKGGAGSGGRHAGENWRKSARARSQTPEREAAAHLTPCPQTPVPHHPGAPSQPTSNDGCRASHAGRWASWSLPPRGPCKHPNESHGGRGGAAGGQGHAPLSAQITCLFRVLTWTPRDVLRLKGQSRLTRSYPGDDPSRRCQITGREPAEECTGSDVHTRRTGKASS